MTISAKVIADSISASGIRITTFELEYPRFIHAEFMTHRMFSRNAASSRAIPVKRAIELIRENTAMPIHWGKNQPGMSAKEECNARWIAKDESTGATLIDWCRETIWNMARDSAIRFAEMFDKLGYHKQIVNRLLEPFTHIKVVCTATEYDNFFWLRKHPDAQPEIQQLAEMMWQALKESTPISLKAGEWHVPYYNGNFGNGVWKPSEYVRLVLGEDDLRHAEPMDDKKGCTLKEAIAVSSSCCAQVSYRKLDDSLDKALSIYKRLVESKPVHASPFEHQASPMRNPSASCGFIEKGQTHCDTTGEYWSGNFCGWIQNRQLIPENVCYYYEG